MKAKLKDLTMTELLLARQWLVAIQADVGIFSANEFNKMAHKRMKDVDQELWKRLVSGERTPWGKVRDVDK